MLKEWNKEVAKRQRAKHCHEILRRSKERKSEWMDPFFSPKPHLSSAPSAHVVQSFHHRPSLGLIQIFPLYELLLSPPRLVDEHLKPAGKRRLSGWLLHLIEKLLRNLLIHSHCSPPSPRSYSFLGREAPWKQDVYLYTSVL